jgi:hypothetical protein
LKGVIRQFSQRFSGLFTDAGVVAALFQLNMTDAQRTGIQPDKRTAKTLVVPGTRTAFQVKKQRDTHSIL